jgi:putative transposase
MSYRQAIFADGQFYHVFNRGVEKRTTFIDRRDYNRFIDSLNYYRPKDQHVRFSFKNRDKIIKEGEIRSSPLLAEIVSYCLMPNHFHLLLRQVTDNGITKFLSKLSNSYTKYFNTRYKRVGPLFQGSFKAVRIESDEQLVHVCRYIHLNPLIDYLVKDLREYTHSSYLEYLGIKEGFCHKSYIMDNFSSPEAYEKFVLNQEDYGRSIKLLERAILEEKI